MAKWLRIVVCCCLGLGSGCRQAPVVEPAFYHWKTVVHPTADEQTYLEALGVRRLYVKFFDVDWDAALAMPTPRAQVVIPEPIAQEIVPCIFITNETFRQLSDADLSVLTDRIAEKIDALWQQIPEQTLREVQFDCDWTTSTRERFFRFLTLFQNKKPDLQLSATIRLHQVRDATATGVPPVHRGMLMLYNTGDLEDWHEDNSILNLTTARYYLQPPPRYPLPLDVALPVFGWGVLFRDGRMIRLINNLQAADLTDTTRFDKIADNRFEVQKSTYLNGYYLYENDQVRIENSQPEQLAQAIELVRPVLRKPRRMRLAFYHLDTTTIKQFPYETLEALGAHFKR
ncbi:MAG TPA: hypothetical protein PKC76_18150 [Saprospiraceae bacterium]|nr:hypothetical protein [Saprospiraceae bacterium]HMP26056.1 hypothetical protein [Saprospiraceae bacterium]